MMPNIFRLKDLVFALPHWINISQMNIIRYKAIFTIVINLVCYGGNYYIDNYVV